MACRRSAAKHSASIVIVVVVLKPKRSKRSKRIEKAHACDNDCPVLCK